METTKDNKKKWIFKVKRNIRREEELVLSFKDSLVTYFYKEKKEKLSCKYRPSTNNKRDYEFLTVECETCNYYWAVFKLSDEKLVIGISIGNKGDYNQKDIGRYVFYRKSN